MSEERDTAFEPWAIEEWFPSPNRETHLNSAGAVLCPVPVKQEVQAFLEAYALDVGQAYKTFLPCVERLRRRLAGLMGATPEEIALTHHTAEGTGIVANGLDWRKGDAIMTLSREYPSTMYPWMHLERTRGVRLVILEEREGRLDEDEIVGALWREKPRLFALSAVEWCSGWRFDLQRIGRACRETGAFFFVDAAQSLGFWECDVRACHVSAMAGSAWKWLFGPPGQGYLYLRRGLLKEVRPTFVGSSSVIDAENYLDYKLAFQPDMRRFEYSTANLSALVWFDAGVRFLRRLGLPEIREHVFALQDYAAQRFRDLGCELRGGQGPPERRSGMMAFRCPGVDSSALSEQLKSEAGMTVPERDGFLRVSFHAYNTRAGIDALVHHVSRLLP